MKMNRPRKDTQILVRLTNEQKEIIKGKANTKGISVSQYVLAMSIIDFPLEKHSPPFVAKNLKKKR
jgi:uncharacterized protein (DUF1778 family)